MVQRRRAIIHAAAIALVHADYAHAGCEPFAGNAQHVLRVARALQTMHNKNGQCTRAIGLPVTLAENTHPRFHFNLALFRRRERDLALQEKTRNGLAMAAPQPSPSPKAIYCFLAHSVSF